MAVTRACSIALFGLVMVACTEPEVDLDLGETEPQALAGGDLQGGDLQGGDLQGGDLQGAIYGGTTASDATINGTALSIWRPIKGLPPRLEERRPNRICQWDLTRTTSYGCTTVDLATTPSPIAGTIFKGQVRRPDDSIASVYLRIGKNATSTGAVAPDKSTAMYRMNGVVSASLCPVVACEAGQQCRRNCDLWTYDIDVITSTGETMPLCPPNTRAYALPGTYDANGTRSPANFTFACMNGTAAKCTRWGYRPFGQANKSDGNSTPLVEYHQSCVRAAMADYCSNGNSFTQNGTLVDVYDFDASGAWLIPRTKTAVTGKTSGLLQESTWDRHGAREIEYLRYAETLQSLDDDEACPNRFSYNPGDDATLDWHRVQGGTWDSDPVIGIDSSTGCAHSELLRGKWLSKHCSTCAFEVSDHPSYSYCTDGSDPRGWDGACVQRASNICTSSQRMVAHSECSAGTSTTQPLDFYATGCTMRVCKENPSCCAPGGDWNAACVNAARTLCPSYRTNGINTPFCGQLQNSL